MLKRKLSMLLALVLMMLAPVLALAIENDEPMAGITLMVDNDAASGDTEKEDPTVTSLTLQNPQDKYAPGENVIFDVKLANYDNLGAIDTSLYNAETKKSLWTTGPLAHFDDAEGTCQLIFEIPSDVQAGEYQLTQLILINNDGARYPQQEWNFTVNIEAGNADAPAIGMVELVDKGNSFYGPGDTLDTKVEVLGNKKVAKIKLTFAAEENEKKLSTQFESPEAVNGLYTLSTLFDDWHVETLPEDRYNLEKVEVTDEAGNVGVKQFTPEDGLYFIFDPDTTAPKLTSLAFDAQGKAVTAGTPLRLLVGVEHDAEIALISATMPVAGGVYELKDENPVIGPDYTYAVLGTVPETAAEGKFFVGSILIKDVNGKELFTGVEDGNFPDAWVNVDNTVPVISEVKLAEHDTTVKPGTTLTTKVKAESNSPITQINAVYSTQQSNLYFAAEYPEAVDGWYTLTCNVTDETISGKYVLSNVMVRNEAGTRGYYEQETQWVTVDSDVTPTTFDETSLKIIPEKDVYAVGDKITVQVNVQSESGLKDSGVGMFSGDHEDGPSNIYTDNYPNSTVTYENGVCSFYFTIPDDAYGTYRLWTIQTEDNNDHTVGLYSDTLTQTITVAEPAVPVMDQSTLKIIPEKDVYAIGDKITVQVNVQSESDLKEGVGCFLGDHEDAPHYIYTDNYPNSTLTYENGVCTFYFTIPDNAYGTYRLWTIEAKDNNGHTVGLYPDTLTQTIKVEPDAVADTTPPTITNVSVSGAEQPLKVGGTVTIRAQITDESAIEQVYMQLEGESGSSDKIELTLTSTPNVYEAKWTASESQAGSTFTLYGLRATDAAGNTALWDEQEYEIIVEASSAELPTPAIISARLVDGSGTLKSGDRFSIEFTLDGVTEIANFSWRFENGTNYINQSSNNYDASTGVYTVNYTVPENAVSGEYTSGPLVMTAQDDIELSWPTKFTVTVANDKVNKSPVASNFSLTQNGQTVDMTANIKADADIRQVYVFFVPENGGDPFSAMIDDLTATSTSDVYAFSFNIPADIAAGKYVFDVFNAWDTNDNFIDGGMDVTDTGLSFTVEALDTAAPVLTGLKLEQQGQTLKAGDALTLKVTVTDESAIALISATMPVTNGMYELKATNPTGANNVYTLTGTVPANAADGKFYVGSILIKDALGNELFTGVEDPSATFPDVWVNVDNTIPTIGVITLDKNGQNLKPGQTVTLSVPAASSVGIDDANATFLHTDGKTLIEDPDEGTSGYNAAVGVYTLQFTIPQTVKAGQYTLNWVAVWNGEGQDVSLHQDQLPRLTFTVDDTNPPVIGTVKLTEDGKTLYAGNTITLQIAVTDESSISKIVVPFGSDNGKTLVAEFKNPTASNGVYTLKYTLPKTDVGTYQLHRVEATDAAGNMGAKNYNNETKPYVKIALPEPAPETKTETKVVESIEDVPVVTKPVAVISNPEPAEDAEVLTLVVTDYKVEDVLGTVLPDVAGDSAGSGDTGSGDSGSEPEPVVQIAVYDLHLENEEGEHEEVPDGTRVSVYLPYPAGYDMYSNVEWKLFHYKTGFENAPIEIPLFPMEKGLYFETSDFSPFVLTWEEQKDDEPAPVTPNLPQTGDHTPLALLAVLMLMSLGGITIITRRKKA